MEMEMTQFPDDDFPEIDMDDPACNLFRYKLILKETPLVPLTCAEADLLRISHREIMTRDDSALADPSDVLENYLAKARGAPMLFQRYPLNSVDLGALQAKLDSLDLLEMIKLLDQIEWDIANGCFSG
jgi:hypothetical protein